MGPTKEFERDKPDLKRAFSVISSSLKMSAAAAKVSSLVCLAKRAVLRDCPIIFVAVVLACAERRDPFGIVLSRFRFQHAPCLLFSCLPKAGERHFSKSLALVWSGLILTRITQ